MLLQMLEALDGYAGIELLRKFDQFTSELPASSSRVVPLPSAKLLELFSSLASAMGVSMGLKLRSPSLESRLHPRQVLPEIELLQNPALGAEDGHGNAASIDVHPEHVRAFSLRWFVLSQDGEELEVSAHDHGADLPASPEVGLEPTPTPVLSNGQTNPFGICANAQSGIATPRGPETEKTLVEPDDHVVDLVGSLANSPGVTSGLAYKLRCNAEPLSVLVVSQVVQFGAVLDLASLDQPEALLSHLEERIICIEKIHPLDPGQREHVQDEAFLHDHQVQFEWRYSSGFWGERSLKVIYKPQFLPQLKQEVSLGEFR